MIEEGIDEQQVLRTTLNDLRAGNIPTARVFKVLHDFGRANFFEAQQDIAYYLTNEDPELRYIALEVLTTHFKLDEYWETARQFLERDSEITCRTKGASSLEVLERNTGSVHTLALLARFVMDEQEDPLLRKVAYRSMRGILNYDSKEQIKLMIEQLDPAYIYDPDERTILTREQLDPQHIIDWNFVTSYLG